MSDFFWKYNVSCNAACHAASGVGPATDYETPYGTPVHAPFAGTAQPYWTDEGGWGVRLVGKDETFCGQHLAEKPRAGTYNHRDVVALTGNSGSATTGPHIHAYIILHSTGERVSFQKWYEDIIGGGSGTPTPPAPQPTGKTFTAPDGDCYWYTSRSDANALRNVHGNGGDSGKWYSDEPMAEGPYEVVEDPGDSFAVRANDGSIIWISGRLRHGLS